MELSLSLTKTFIPANLSLVASIAETEIFSKFMIHKTLIRDASPDLAANYIAIPVPCPICFFLDEEHEARLQCHALFGRMLHFEELVALCGGDAEKTEMTVGVVENGLYLEYHHIPSDCIGSCRIRQTADSRLVLVNEHVRFLSRDKVEKKKYCWFSRQKTACEVLGISTIHITGARTSISQGYYYYPLFGFDAPLPTEFCRFLPKEIAHCRTLINLFKYQQGRKIWFLQGFSCEMMFDLHNDNGTLSDDEELLVCHCLLG